jgi:hypothetical protein
MAIIAGYPWFGASELIKASMVENTAYCKRTDANFAGFTTAWPMHEPENRKAAADEGEPPAGEHAVPHPVKAEHAAEAMGEDPLSHGHELVEKFVAWAFLVGIGVGFFVYMNGYWIAAPLTKSGPLALIRIWLYRRMYFDELYFTFLVGGVMALSWMSAMFDRYVVDGLVNFAGWFVKQSAFVAGANDKYIVDGAVNGIASVTQDLGAAVRAPQTGRIRMYVTILMAAVAVGLAVAIIVALS